MTNDPITLNEDESTEFPGGARELPHGYQWKRVASEAVPRIYTPTGAWISGCYGDAVSATIEARVRAAWADHALGNVPVPPGVDADVWWRFASMADDSIYPHCLSHVDHVDHAADRGRFEAAGLIRGALAVYTTKARSGLRAGSGMLSAKHADKWAAFETVG